MILPILISIGVLFLLLSVFLSFRFENIDEFLTEHTENRKIFLSCIVVFLILFNISLLIFYYRSNLYVRPLSYFFILSLGVIPITCEVFFVPKRKFYHLIILAQIIVLSFSYVATLNSLYPTLLGVDPWGHKILVEEILLRGHLTQNGGYDTVYKLLPAFHLNVSSFSLIANVGYKFSSILLISFSTLTIIIFSIYIMIQNIFNTKLALISALVIGISNNVLHFLTISIIPNTMGIALLVLVLALCLKNGYDHRSLAMIFLFSFVITITHSFTSILLVFQAFVITSVTWIYKKETFWDELRLLVSFFILVFGYFLFVATYYGQNLIRHVRTMLSGQTTEYAGGGPSPIPLFDLFLGRLGLISFTALAIAGLFWMLRYKRNHKQFIILALGGTMVGLSVIGFLAANIQGIGSRFWFFMQIVCAVAVVFAFLLIPSPCRKISIRKAVVILLIFSLTFVMLTSPTINNDNPLVIYQGSSRTGLKESEVSGAEFMVENINEEYPIYSDNYYIERIGSYYIYLKGYPHNSSLGELNSPSVNHSDFLESSGYIVIRNEMYNRGVSWKEGFQKVSREEMDELDTSRNKIYENNEVAIYGKPFSEV